MTVCILCAMRALVKGEPPPTFEEAPQAHAARLHPDPVAAAREKQTLMQQIEALPRPPKGLDT